MSTTALRQLTRRTERELLRFEAETQSEVSPLSRNL
jgi:hypothetical protein